MLKLYTDVNAMTSEVGEMLNTYFMDPVSRTVSQKVIQSDSSS